MFELCLYLVMCMSVSVCVCVCVCVPQGVVCTLHEGDDFGKLALVTDSPRAASIVLREDNCHFLRVDKEDFNRILRVRAGLCPDSDGTHTELHKHPITPKCPQSQY